MPKCRLHSDCVAPDAQQTGRTISVARIGGGGVTCAHCKWLFCCNDCLAGHLTGLNPGNAKPVVQTRICRHLPSAEDEADELLDIEILQQHVGLPAIPEDLSAVAEHTRLCIETSLRVDKRWGIVVMELYAGCGQHGRIVARTLRQLLSLKEADNGRVKRAVTSDPKKHRPPVLLLSIDKLPGALGTTLVVDARGLNAANLALLKGKFPHMAVVLLASPPCQEYSHGNTKPGPRDLVGADTLVKVVHECHQRLSAVCTVMENPAWPGLLPGRNVAKFLRSTCVLHYCAHGGMFHKPTQLWSGTTKPLRKGFSLQEHGFKAMTCKGRGECPILLYDAHDEEWLHPQWEGTKLAERQVIPPQVSRAVGGAIASFINQLTSV